MREIDRERERERERKASVVGSRAKEEWEKHGEKSVTRIRGVLARDGRQLSSRRENNGNYPR